MNNQKINRKKLIKDKTNIKGRGRKQEKKVRPCNRGNKNRTSHVQDANIRKNKEKEKNKKK